MVYQDRVKRSAVKTGDNGRARPSLFDDPEPQDRTYQAIGYYIPTSEIISQLYDRDYGLLFGYIFKMSNGPVGACIASTDTMSAETTISTGKIKEIIRDLVDNEFLKHERRGRKRYLTITEKAGSIQKEIDRMKFEGNLDQNVRLDLALKKLKVKVKSQYKTGKRKERKEKGRPVTSSIERNEQKQRGRPVAAKGRPVAS
jgi:hypothetical protein